MHALGTGEMSRLSGLSLKALRLYDANGLLVPAEVDDRTGYRRYAPAQLERARTIAMLRRVELPLALIAELLDAEPRIARERLLSWWSAEQHAFAARSSAVARIAGTEVGRDAAPGDVEARIGFEELPDRAVAGIVRTVEQAQLVPAFLADAVEIRRHLVGAGAAASPELWVLFHSPVGPGLPGRIETAVPFSGPATPTRRIGLRVEPAARYAVAELSAREVAFRQVLRVHEAVRAAAGGRAHDAAPSREWYPGPWPEDPDEVAMRVAVPMPA